MLKAKASGKHLSACPAGRLPDLNSPALMCDCHQASIIACGRCNHSGGLPRHKTSPMERHQVIRRAFELGLGWW